MTDGCGMENLSRTGWQVPVYTPPVRRTAFVVLASLGVFALWFFALGMVVLEMGDCAIDGSPGVCERLWAQQGLHLRLVTGLLAVDTVVAVLAVLRGRRVLPALLLLAGIVTLVFAIASLPLTSDMSSLLPRGYFLAVPAGLLFVVAAGWQVLRWRPERHPPPVE